MAFLNNLIVTGQATFHNSINGNGSNLTNLNASNISSGTLAKERLATSGVTAGSAGPTAAVTGNEGTTVAIPRITVDTYGRVTALTSYNLTNKNTTYTIPTSLKNPNALKVQGNGTNSFTYDGSAAKTLNIKAGTNVTVSSDTSGNITINSSYTNTNYYHTTGSWSGLTYTATANGGAGTLAFTIPTGTTATTVAVGNHTHNYAGSASAGGAASSLAGFKITTTTSLGVDGTDVNQAIGYVGGLTKANWNYQQTDGALYRQVNSASWIHQIFGDYRTGQISVRGRNNGTWTSWRRILDETNYTSIVTLAGIGAAAASHGNHVPTTQTANNAVFLRNDNTWQTVTPANIGAAEASHGNHVPSFCSIITDWNNATTNGWYMGQDITNAPGNAWWFGRVVAHNAKYVFQEAWKFAVSTTATSVPHYIRMKVNGTWGAWADVTVAKAVPSNAVFTDTRDVQFKNGSTTSNINLILEVV